jgi:riboflavin synthase
MFTGLIEEVGTVRSIREGEPSKQLQIVAPRTARKLRVGDSVAVNGCCLTLSARRGDQLTFDLLERALRADARLGGHFVQGHVDCTSRIINFEQRRGDRRLEVELPAEFARYVARKGSIAIDGISLTIAEVSSRSFAVWIVPHTKRQTNLGHAEAGGLVNLEFDILAKYVERLLSRHAPQG